MPPPEESPRDEECRLGARRGSRGSDCRAALEHWDSRRGLKEPEGPRRFTAPPRRNAEEMSGRSPGGHGQGGVLEHSTRVTFPFLICFLPPSLHTHTRERRVGESSSRVLQRNIISARTQQNGTQIDAELQR